MDRNNSPNDKKFRETEAVAFVVCHGIGLETNSAGSDHIQLYNGDKKTLKHSLDRMQRTAAEILGRGHLFRAAAEAMRRILIAV